MAIRCGKTAYFLKYVTSGYTTVRIKVVIVIIATYNCNRWPDISGECKWCILQFVIHPTCWENPGVEPFSIVKVRKRVGKHGTATNKPLKPFNIADREMVLIGAGQR